MAAAASEHRADVPVRFVKFRAKELADAPSLGLISSSTATSGLDAR